MGERSRILRLLTRKVGQLPDALHAQVDALPVNPLEALGDVLFDFSNLSSLEAWLVGQK